MSRGPTKYNKAWSGTEREGLYKIIPHYREDKVSETFKSQTNTSQVSKFKFNHKKSPVGWKVSI